MNQWQPTLQLRRYLTQLVSTCIVKPLQFIKQWYTQPIQSWLYRHSLWSVVSLFLAGISLSILLAACSLRNVNYTGNASAASQPNVTLTFVSYSVTSAAYEQIIPKFIEQWKKEHNQNVTFNQSYDASASQTLAAVIEGKEADVVHLSLALDINKLVEAGFIQPGWEKEAPNNAIVTKSVDAIAIREGNPKNIKTWADLAKDGVKIVTANPKTSGAARWSFLNLWGSAINTGGNENQAIDFISKVYNNAPVLPKTARNASELFFKDGQGDVLLNYEKEMIVSDKNGKKLPYIVPDINISIDNPVAVVDKNVDKHGTRSVAEAFIKFLYTPDSQREFAKLGFRSVNLAIAKETEANFPKIKTIFKAEDLGGWDEIQAKFFDEGTMFDKIRAKKST